MNAFERLISQVDGFIRKFYKNQIVKGLILFCGVLLITYLLVICLEYVGRFSSSIRAALFFSFIVINGLILGKLIILPILRLNSFGKRINRHQAALIIGKFFPNISDRLLNTLQLSDRMDENSADYELLSASVVQRSASLTVVPFADAVNLGENRKYVMWVLPIVLTLFTIGVFAPSILKQGTERVVYFNHDFPIQAPFEFELNKKGLERVINEGEDFNFEVLLTGNEVPQKVYVHSMQGKFLLSQSKKNAFNGTIPQLRQNASIYFSAADSKGNEFKSNVFDIEVIAKTAVGKLEAVLEYPMYLGLANDTVQNVGDLTLPEGTIVTWNVLTKNSTTTEFIIGQRSVTFKDNGFRMKQLVKNSIDYRIVLLNEKTSKRDTSNFQLVVIKDQFPSIQVQEVSDSLKEGLRYFTGLVGDDYGLKSLFFVYTIKSKNGGSRTEKINVAAINGTEAPFNFAVDFRREKLVLEDKIEYYFVIYDNDGVNGSKSTRSQSFEYKLPSLEELNEKRDLQQESVKKDLSDVKNKAAEFQKDIKKLRKDLLNTKQSDWNKQNQIQQLKEEHKSLIEQLENLNEKMANSLEEKNQLSEVDKQLMEQQEMIEELLRDLMDDELKSLLEELEELLKKQDKDGLEKNLEKLEMSSEDMKKQMDRSLEMLKKLQVNEKIDDLESELKKLAEEQRKLKNDIEQSKQLSELDKKKQEEINKAFEDIKKDLKEIDSLNKNLEKPLNLGDTKEDSEKITKDLQESKDQLNKNKDKKAGESQKSAADEMEKLAEKLDERQKQSNQQQQQEDIDMLRGILESLVLLSFDQEDNMNKLRRIVDTDPSFRTYGRQQRRIIDDTRIVRDSLYALAKRQPKIASFVDKELNHIQVNHELSLEDLDERRRRDLTIHQQFAMTSYNNLALMLNESLQQMQKQMQDMMEGSGSCSNPGGKGKPKSGDKMSSDDMKEMLKKQLDDMKKGQNPGGKEPGKSEGEGQGTMFGNEKLAKMAAEQAMIRKRLEQLKKELNKDGKGTGNKLNPLLDELERQENDLINKRLDNNLIKRQQDILTRLLESEKAIKERGFDDKRESKEGKIENNSNHIRFEEYNKEKLKQIELLRSVDPSYNKYYKDRANEYFNRVM